MRKEFLIKPSMKRKHSKGGSCLRSSLNSSVILCCRDPFVPICVFVCAWGNWGDEGILGPASRWTKDLRLVPGGIHLVYMSIKVFIAH